MSTIEDVDSEPKTNTDNNSPDTAFKEISNDSPIDQLKQSRTSLREEKINVDNELKPIAISSSVATRMENVFGANPQSPNEFAQLRSLTDKKDSIDSRLKNVEHTLGIDGIEGLVFNQEANRYEITNPQSAISVLLDLNKYGYDFSKQNGKMVAKRDNQIAEIYLGSAIETAFAKIFDLTSQFAEMIEKYGNLENLPMDVMNNFKEMAIELKAEMSNVGLQEILASNKGIVATDLMKVLTYIVIVFGCGKLGSEAGVGGLAGMSVGLMICGLYKIFEKIIGRQVKKASVELSEDVDQWLDENPKFRKYSLLGIAPVVIAILIALANAKSCGGSEKGHYVPDFNKHTIVDPDNSGGKDAKKDAPKDNGTSGQEDSDVQKPVVEPVVTEIPAGVDIIEMNKNMIKHLTSPSPSPQPKQP